MCVCVWLYDADIMRRTKEKGTPLPYRCGDILRGAERSLYCPGVMQRSGHVTSEVLLQVGMASVLLHTLGEKDDATSRQN